MRRTRLLATCLAAALAAGSCQPKDEPDARFVSVADIKGFDPVFCNDQYSAGAQVQVYEGLTEFAYLKRPVELVPLLAEATPEVSKDGLVYTFKIRDAVFQDDPCFPQGKGRKVLAQDFVWCWKRLMADPSSTGSWIFEGKIAGLDEWTKKAQAIVRPMYDRVNEHYPVEAPEMRAVMAESVAGLSAPDEHTLRVQLVEPYPQFMWTTAMPFTVVYPPEACTRYGIDLMNHPVGTGAYHVEDYWVFDKKITFVRNPTWHGGTYPADGSPGDREAGLLDDAGKALPFLDRIEFVTIVESQPRWLRFLSGNLDRVETEREIWEKAMTPEGKLRKELADQGVVVRSEPMADIAFTSFNMKDQVFGAPAGERGKKIRQAMCLAMDQQLWIKVMRNGFWAVPAYGPVPPGLAGYLPDVKSPYVDRDVERAKKLLAEAGYPEGRGLPHFVYEMNGSDAVSRTGCEIFRNCMKDIGIDVELRANTWDQFDDKVKKQAAQVFGMAWSADYPDAQNFLQLFYGPNESPGPNNSNYRNADYDALYDQMKVMQPGAERDAVIRKMLLILNEDCPWSYTDHRIRFTYFHDWLKNYKYLDINPWLFKYYRIDRERRGAKAEADAPPKER
jgi:oligopeptide transport system substrate-binding protein